MQSARSTRRGSNNYRSSNRPARLCAPHFRRVVVWDVAHPSRGNWTFVQACRQLPAATGRGLVFTTNLEVLQAVAGPVPVLEFLGRPYSIAELTSAVRRVWPKPALGEGRRGR